MSIDKFDNVTDVMTYIRKGGDAWGYPIVEEYIGGLSSPFPAYDTIFTDPIELSIDRFNGLDVDDLNRTVTEGKKQWQKEYENFIDNKL